MFLSEFIIRNFRRKEAVKCYYVGEDKKVSVHWVIPQDDKFTFNDKTFIITPEKIYLQDGITTVFLNYKNAEPINITDIDFKVYTPKKFNEGLSAKVVNDLINANGRNDKMAIGLLVIFLVIGILIYTVYNMNTQFNNLNDLINQLIEQTGGGVN